MLRLSPLLIVALLCGGCTKKAKPERGTAPPKAVMTTPPMEDVARPVPMDRRLTRDEICVALKKRFRKVLATATRKCKTDADCGSYSPFVNCGGVVDRPTADKLGVIRKEAWTAKCGWGISCAARLRAEPRCSRGRCIADRSRWRTPSPKGAQGDPLLPH